MTGLFVVKCEFANLVVAIAIKVADKGLAVIGQVTTNLSLRGSVLRRFFVAIIVKVANFLAVNNGVARIVLLNRIRKLLKIKTEVNTFLFASETDFGKDRFYQKVKDDYDSGLENDVQGTPTFFVNGEQFDGNWMNSEFLEYLESLIVK